MIELVEMPTIATLHGWKANSNYMRVLNDYWRRAGFNVVNIWYGKILFTRFGRMERIARDKVLPELLRINGPVIVRGHSNALTMAVNASRQGADNIIGMVSSNGAYNRYGVIPYTWQFCLNYFSPGDKVLSSLARWRPWHEWGMFGAGRTVLSPSGNITDINIDELCAHKGLMIETDHDDFIDHPDVLEICETDAVQRVRHLIEPPRH